MLGKENKKALFGSSFKIIAIIFVLINLFLLSGCYSKEKKYLDIIRKQAELYAVDPYLVLAVCRAESNFKVDAKSNRGAIGIMQLMPSTASWLAEEKLLLSYTESMLVNAEFNIKLGSYYLSYLSRIFQDTDWAIVAYNAGEGIALKWKSLGISKSSIPYYETQNYLYKVKKWIRKYQYLQLFN